MSAFHLSRIGRAKKRKEIKNWNFERTYRQNIYLFHTRTHTSRFTYPPKRERERERAKTRAHTHTRPRQTDQTPSKSVMQGDHDNATTNTNVVNPGGEKQAEIYTHDAPWLIYACNWSVRCCLLFYVCRFRNRESFSSPSFWVVFSLSSYAYRIGCDPRENGYVPSLCHRARALFFVSRSEKKDG